MLKIYILIISFFALMTSRGQGTLTVQQVDSIVATIDTSNLLDSYTRVDSSNLSAQTQKATTYSYKKLKKTGEVVKVVRIGNGTCDSKDQYYFLNGKIIKAVINLICDGKLTWDSELYYFNDTAFAQKDNAIALYWPAFIQTAYSDLKRVVQLDTVTF